MIEKHCKKRADQLTKSDIAVSESDLDQALNQWIEIIDDVQELNAATNETANEIINKITEETVNEPANEPANKPANEPAAE